MASALEQRANYLQDFMRHVSHEFKTPLAGIGAAVEVLQDHDGNMDEARRRQFLDNIAADARRMTRLTQRLLELTRAELNNPATQTINVENAAAAFVETAAVEGVTLSSRSSLISSTALGNSQALGAVFEILLENSIQHGASRFELLLSASTDGGRIVITAQDNGEGITPGNRPKVFEPFFTTERGSGGTGLGLSIAEALLRRFGGTLRLVDDESAGGARFEITLRAEQP
jgi:signal transduction histidine kinase